jgi:hypothetical protein
MIRPVLWWAFTTGLFAWAYLAKHFEVKSSYPWGTGGWLVAALKSNLDLAKSAASLLRLTCIEGGQNPALAALFLSLKKGIVGLGFGPEETQAYICLYGKVSTSGVPQPIPLIPESVAYLGLVQPLISTVLIFLLLLAVRNHFRIK